MEKLNSEDGQLFIKNLASFVRTHEKALANALQLRRQSVPSNNYAPSTSSTLAAALSFGALKFTSQNVKPAKLTLTPHHLFYLLSQFEDLSIAVGSMNVRLENIHNDSSSSYVSFLNQPRRSRGDRDSIHSVSSVRSVMSGMSAVWSSFGLGSKDSATKSEKAKAALETDLKYLYSAFTKIPCLRLAPDRRARLIRGYEEFPLDTAVPLHAFKNLSALEIIDIDFRSFYGWDRLSEQLRTLTLKRANINDPADLVTKIVLDDVDKRRRRSSKSHPSPIPGGSITPQPVYKYDYASNTSNDHKPVSAPGSPSVSSNLATSTSPKSVPMLRAGSEGERGHRRTGSYSPTRPQTASRQHTQSRHSRGHSVNKVARSSSGSSNSSEVSLHGNRSSSNLLTGVLPPSKWRFLRHLGLADNSLTTLSSDCFLPVANTLHSLDLSSNLFAEIPDSLPSLVALRALNLSNCMINSLRSISKNPLPAITALNLRGNRLSSLAGIERLLSLERLDLRDNNLTDPTEIARLTGLPEIREIWVSGNPFTKTHSNYRVTIFNLFRRTPGFTEDILIDASGPGYTERKQLVDRAAEPEAAPVVRPVDPEPARTVSKVPAPVRQELLSQDTATAAAAAAAAAASSTTTTTTETTGNTQHKRGNRRRIVDLSREESVTQVFTSPSSQDKPLPPDPPVLVDPFTASGTRPENATPADVEPVKKPVTQSVSQDQKVVPAKQDSSIDWNTNFSLGGETNIFRPRLEAVPNNNNNNSGWLSVLHEGNWQTQPSRPQANMSAVPRTGTVFDASLIRPDTVSRPESHLLVSGRTVG
ncbi:Leucine Rich Repeat domain protein [Talaromyces stipitatus ATCC 10500]|uniref:Leucine Rich Repeat domain protein n=1 Tax=Talaromyces stipitatus (strain ATCC 10500 / CBS 375.48 / QM 6759 / NRRL 1006) TaxID=441959 RepID=B8MH18_TALSN|nr:Leucine Rich Repeat domain protein [Talaromyces stipitatus ATCC 10500]EED16832.1 Leucine Rich Repeat domain protein [Talaromyces stipitatus ATCC 10500]